MAVQNEYINGEQGWFCVYAWGKTSKTVRHLCQNQSMTALRTYFTWIIGPLLLVWRTATLTVIHKIRVKNSFSDISSLVNTTRPAAGGQQRYWSIFCCLLCHGCQRGGTWAELCCLSWAYKEYWLECKHVHACLRAHTHRQSHIKQICTHKLEKSESVDRYIGYSETERHVGKGWC